MAYSQFVKYAYMVFRNLLAKPIYSRSDFGPSGVFCSSSCRNRINKMFPWLHIITLQYSSSSVPSISCRYRKGTIVWLLEHGTISSIILPDTYTILITFFLRIYMRCHQIRNPKEQCGMRDSSRVSRYIVA